MSIEPSACSGIGLLHGVLEHLPGGPEVPHVDEPGATDAHAARPRLVHVPEVQVVRLVLLDVVEQRLAAGLRTSGDHVEAQVVDQRRHVRAEHVDPWQPRHLGGELALADLGQVRPGASRQAAAHEAHAQPVDVHRLAVEVADPRPEQVAELLGEVRVAVRQVRPVGEPGEHGLVLGTGGGPDLAADLRLPAGHPLPEDLARLVEAPGGPQPGEAPRRLRPVHLRHDPLQRPVVDEVEEVAAHQQHVRPCGRHAELLGGAVDVGNDLDPNYGSLRRLGRWPVQACWPMLRPEPFGSPAGGCAGHCGYLVGGAAGGRRARRGATSGRMEESVPLPGGPVVGTCGFGYQEWRGRFYPPELTPAEWLGFYARVFEAVELDGTFYRPASISDRYRGSASKRCGSNSSIGRSVVPVRASCAAISPRTGANLKPWPEKPASSVRPGRSRRCPTAKCWSGVSEYMHDFMRTGRGRRSGRVAATMAATRSASAASGGRGPWTGSTGSSMPGQECSATLTVAPSRLGQPYQAPSPPGSSRTKTGKLLGENASSDGVPNQACTRRTTRSRRSSPGSSRGIQAPAATTTWRATSVRSASRTAGRSPSGTISSTVSPSSTSAPAARAARTASTTPPSGRTTPAAASKKPTVSSSTRCCGKRLRSSELESSSWRRPCSLADADAPRTIGEDGVPSVRPPQRSSSRRPLRASSSSHSRQAWRTSGT